MLQILWMFRSTIDISGSELTHSLKNNFKMSYISLVFELYSSFDQQSESQNFSQFPDGL